MLNTGYEYPGAVLKTFLDDYHLNPTRLARAIGLSQTIVRLIVLGEAKISVNVALRLAKYFGNSPKYWLYLQNHHDISAAAQDEELNKILGDIPRAKKDNRGKDLRVRRKVSEGVVDSEQLEEDEREKVQS
jgi:addiction module HigA family antidote